MELVGDMKLSPHERFLKHSRENVMESYDKVSRELEVLRKSLSHVYSVREAAEALDKVKATRKVLGSA